MIEKAKEIHKKVELLNKLNLLLEQASSFYTKLYVENSINQEFNSISVDDLKEEFIEILTTKKEIIEEEIKELMK